MVPAVENVFQTIYLEIELINFLRVELLEGNKSIYNFTTLSAQGRYGPTSVEGYKNTTLDSKVTLFNGIQEWKVPYSGNYKIKAAGAAGGFGNRSNPIPGKGALIEGEFFLEEGNTLRILVGQKGLSNKTPNSGGGGGGGTFICGFKQNKYAQLLVAGGGNGDSWIDFQKNGVNALDDTNKGDVQGKRTNGRAGGGGSFTFNGDSFENSCSGISFLNGGAGGEKYHQGPYGAADGGFGGGGGCLYEGGGGGGYMGGSVVPENDYNGNHDHLGSGSFNKGENQINRGGINEGDGYVIIENID